MKQCNYENQTSSFDRTIKSLCNEIDDLKCEVEYWKNLYQEQLKENQQMFNEKSEEIHKNLSNTIQLAFKLKEDGDGNLYINKDDRKVIAEKLK